MSLFLLNDKHGYDVSYIFANESASSDVMDMWPLKGGTVKLKNLIKRSDKGKQWEVDRKDTVKNCIMWHIYVTSEEVFKASHVDHLKPLVCLPPTYTRPKTHNFPRSRI